MTDTTPIIPSTVEPSDIPQEAISERARALTDRTALWKATLEAELQRLITEAATIQRQVKEAKTHTKQQYFSKKFKKLTPEIMQMVAALDRLNRADTSDPAAPNV